MIIVSSCALAASKARINSSYIYLEFFWFSPHNQFTCSLRISWHTTRLGTIDKCVAKWRLNSLDIEWIHWKQRNRPEPRGHWLFSDCQWWSRMQFLSLLFALTSLEINEKTVATEWYLLIFTFVCDIVHTKTLTSRVPWEWSPSLKTLLDIQHILFTTFPSSLLAHSFT